MSQGSARSTGSAMSAPAASTFNRPAPAHLGDFALGWIQVLAVGALGGMALQRTARQPAGSTTCGNPDLVPAPEIRDP